MTIFDPGFASNFLYTFGVGLPLVITIIVAVAAESRSLFGASLVLTLLLFS
jgi:hypothetical protein